MLYTDDEVFSVWTKINTNLRNKLILRAKIDNVYVDKHGKVDIGAVLHLLLETYANGDYTIIHKNKEKE